MKTTPLQFFSVNRFLYDLLTEDKTIKGLTDISTALRLPLARLRRYLISNAIPRNVSALRSVASALTNLLPPPPVYLAYKQLDPDAVFDDRVIELITPIAPWHFDYMGLFEQRYSRLSPERLGLFQSQW